MRILNFVRQSQASCPSLLTMNVRGWRWTYVALGVLLRIVLLLWGTWQDKHAVLPYTDVDYAVYNDGAHAMWAECALEHTVESPLFEAESDLFDEPSLAAHVRCARGYIPAVSRFVLQNDPLHSKESSSFPENSLFLRASRASFWISRPLFKAIASLGDPYSRATYRYTPLLALILSPAHAVEWAPPIWGKLLFALGDIVCALLMWAILDTRASHHAARSLSQPWATHLPGLLWLLNPFPAQIATRGSADSLVLVLVLGFIALLLRATPEMELVGSHAIPGDAPEKPGERTQHDPADLRVADEVAWYGAAALLALAVHFKLYPVIYGSSVLAHLATYRRHAIRILCGIKNPGAFDVNILGIEFAAIAGMMYAVLNLGVWLFWGQPFVRHALLYHVTRQDPKHNFSVYFLSTYLAGSFDASSTPPIVQTLYSLAASPLASFVPQLLACAYVGFTLGGKDLVLSCAVQTVVFVAWNKVYTSQYFLWYLVFVPIVGVTLHFDSYLKPVFLAGLWAAAQGIWLYWAYRLEFMAQDTFVPLWLSSMLLLATQVYLVQSCLTAWESWRQRQVVAHAKSQ